MIGSKLLAAELTGREQKVKDLSETPEGALVKKPLKSKIKSALRISNELDFSNHDLTGNQ